MQPRRFKKRSPPPTPPKAVVAAPVQVRRPRFQFPLYILLIMTTVIGLALAPASYFMRAAADDRITRSNALIFMIAAPMLLVIVMHAAYRAWHWFRK